MIEPSAAAGPAGAPAHAGFEALVLALVQGRSQEADALAAGLMGADLGLEAFYLRVIGPAMHRVGLLWERQEINVAQEHIATSLVTRMMSCAHARLEPRIDPDRRAVVTAVPGERHHIGAWMVSDLLEADGWNSLFAGADTPREDLIALLDSFRPQLLALSVTLPGNLEYTAALIAGIRPAAPGLRIMVGGRAFARIPDPAGAVGADGWAGDARTACLLAERWRESGVRP